MLDWFTIFAQIFNFLILIYLLRRFLYRPILKAIAAREERIAKTVAEAERAKADALLQIQEYQHKNEAWEHEREAMVIKARQEIDELRREMMSKAHHDVQVAQDQWQKALQQQKQAFLQRLRQQVNEQTFKVAQRVLVDLAETDLEQRIIDVFLRRLELLDSEEMENLKSSLVTSDGALLVRSSFDLTPENRLPIQDTLARKLENVQSVEFETTPELMSGIELRSNGYKLSWNLSDYLKTLEEALNEQIP